jgi:hypothetical protein
MTIGENKKAGETIVINPFPVHVKIRIEINFR